VAAMVSIGIIGYFLVKASKCTSRGNDDLITSPNVKKIHRYIKKNIECKFIIMKMYRMIMTIL